MAKRGPQGPHEWAKTLIEKDGGMTLEPRTYAITDEERIEKETIRAEVQAALIEALVTAMSWNQRASGLPTYLVTALQRFYKNIDKRDERLLIVQLVDAAHKAGRPKNPENTYGESAYERAARQLGKTERQVRDIYQKAKALE